MGLLEQAKVLLSIKADASQAKAEIRSLRGVEKQAAQERINEMASQEAKLDSQIARWGKVAVAIGAAAGAYKIAQNAANAYLEDLKLEAAAAGANIDKLKVATAGLVEEDKLLEFAGKSLNGMWALSQKEMEAVAKGGLALRKQFGKDLPEVLDQLGEAVAKGATRPLKEYGIAAKDKAGLIKELAGRWQELGGNATVAGDDIRRAQTSMADSVDELQGKLGEMVVALSPVIDAMAALVGWLADAISGLDRFASSMGGGKLFQGENTPAFIEASAQVGQIDKQIANRRALLAKRGTESGGTVYTGGYGVVREEVPLFSKYYEDIEHEIQQLEADRERAKARAAQALQKYKGGLATPPKTKDRERGADGRFELNYTEADGFSGYGSLSAKMAADAGTVGVTDIGKAESYKPFDAERERWFSDDDAAILAELREETQRFREEQEKIAALKTETKFSQVFGTAEEFDATNHALSTMASTFGVLQDAAGSAYDSIISGSGLSAAAMKKIVAQGIAALGKENFIRGLGEAAHALAALAWGNFPKAAAHGAAAGQYFAVAAAAGVAANVLGYGDAATPSPPAGRIGGGRAMSAGSGGGASVTRHVTVILGGGFDNMTERERNARFARAVKRGMGADSSTTIRDG